MESSGKRLENSMVGDKTYKELKDCLFALWEHHTEDFDEGDKCSYAEDAAKLLCDCPPDRMDPSCLIHSTLSLRQRERK